MKLQKVLKFLTVALSVLLLGSMLTVAVPVSAAPMVTLSPTSGAPGTVIAIAGSGWAPTGTITIQSSPYWGGVSPTATVGPGGTFTASITVPATATDGVYRIFATSTIGAEFSYADFTVITGFTLSAASGFVGDTVTVSGTGFAAGASVPLFWDTATTPLTTATANGIGVVSASVTIPAAAFGNHTIATTGGARAATFAVNPKIVLSAASGEAGALVGINGTGFAGTSAITVSGITGLTGVAATTSTNGSFSASFNVPANAPRAAYTVTATDAATHSATATFNVVQSITVTLPTGQTKVTPGDVITISGKNFAPGTVTFKLDGTAISGLTGTADLNYALAAVSFTVPDIKAGAHTITAVGSDLAETSAEFSVQPKVVLSNIDGMVGSQVSISGVGFAANSAVTITFSGNTTVLANATTDANGKLPSTAFAVPVNAGGDFLVSAKDASNNLASAAFKVTSSMSVTPTTGVYEDIVTVTGTGFLPNRDVAFLFNRSTTNYPFPDSVKTAADGTFSIDLSILFVPAGTWNVQAYYINTATILGSSPVSVTSKIVVSPASGVKGDQINILGYGFGANKTITLKYNNAILPANLLQSDSNGYFVTVISMPGGQAGSYLLEATDGSNTGKMNVTALASATLTPVTTSSSPGYVGLELTATGSGFKASAEVSISFDGTQVLLATATTTSDGSFDVTFMVPAVTPGQKSVLVTDGTNSKSFAFYMEAKAPEKPALAGPTNNFKPKQPVPFSWYSVTDASGVTYEFQLSRDPNFQTVLLSKTGLTGNSYTLSASDTITLDGKTYTGDKLPNPGGDTPYLWRVRAVDGAGNAGEWSAVNNFTVGFIMPGWLIHVWYGIGIVLALILGLWLGRRMAYQSY